MTVTVTLIRAATEDDRFSTMGRFFVIAFVLVTPFAFVTARRILTSRRDPDTVGVGPSERAAGTAENSGTDENLGTAPREPEHDLAWLVAAIDEFGRGVDDTSAIDSTIALGVPDLLAEATVGEAADPVTRLVVADAMRRNSVTGSWVASPDGPRLELRRRP